MNKTYTVIDILLQREIKMKKISFVIPCYRSENTIETVVNEIDERMIECREKNLADDYEIILVNDCSPDNVWSVLEKLAETRQDVTAINLAKNFGQHAALMAGYAHCSGDYILSLDDDGQAPLDALNRMLQKIEEGYDVVYAYYKEIKQNAFRRLGSFVASLMGQMCLQIPKDFRGSSFYVARKFIIDEMLNYKNAYPYLMGLVFRTTRNIASIETEHRSRLVGTSGYSFRSLLSLWLNGFTAFSVKPLELSVYLGSFTSVIGFIYAIVVIIRRILHPEMEAGWSSIISIQLITSGIIMIMLGLIGEYIGRIYISINNSPQYVIKEVKGNRQEE